MEEQKNSSQKLGIIINDIRIIKESCENVRPEFLNVSIYFWFIYIYVFNTYSVYFSLGYNQRGGKDGFQYADVCR